MRHCAMLRSCLVSLAISLAIVATVSPAGGQELSQPKKNAAENYRAAFAQMKYPIDPALEKKMIGVVENGWGEQRSDLEKVLEDNQAAFAAFDKVDYDEHCHFLEGVEILPETDMPHIFPARKFARLVLLRGRHEAHLGNFDKGLASCSKVVQLVIAVTNDRTIISRLVGTNILNIASKCLVGVARDPKCDDTALAEAQKHITAIWARRLPYSATLDTEYKTFALVLLDRTLLKDPKEVDEATLGPKPVAKALRESDEKTRKAWYEETKKVLEHYFDRYKNACPPSGLAELPKIKQDLEKTIAEAELVPRFLVSGILRVYGTAGIAEAKAEAQIGAVSLTFALQRHAKTTKSYPDSLEKLVPDHLGAVPVDPFDGKPFRYAKEADGCKFYSVGPDLTDNGGEKQYDEMTEEPGTDMIWRLP